MPTAIAPGTTRRTVKVASRPGGMTIRQVAQDAMFPDTWAGVVPNPNSGGFDILPDDAPAPTEMPIQFIPRYKNGFAETPG